MTMALALGKGKRSSKGQPCPVCDNHHGCKLFNDFVYCLRLDSLADGTNGYAYIKELSDGMGSVFAAPWFVHEVERTIENLKVRGERPTPSLIAEKTGIYSTWIWILLQRRNLVPRGYTHEDEERQRQRQAEARAYKAAVRQRLLSLDERHQQYRSLLSQLTLDPNHRVLLARKGLSASAVDRIGFKTWVPRKKVADVTDRLAGIDRRGDRLMGGNGIFIPAYDPLGRLVGGQIRTDSGRPGKYIWVSSVIEDKQTGENIGGNGPQMPDEGLPLFVCRPGVSKTNAIGLCEGGLKAFATAELLGQVMIGAAGGHFDSKLLKEYLSILSAALDTKTVILYPDAGAIANTGSIPYANHKTLKWCKAWGYEVHVAWWNQYSKRSDLDIDDLLVSEGEPREIHLIHPQKFFDLHPLSIRKRLEPHEVKVKEGLYRSDFPITDLTAKVQESQHPLLIYERSNRLDVWRAAVESGTRFILDRSGMGSGKSYDSGRCTPALLGATQLIYIANDHRNPTTETLKTWEDLEGRHGGLVEVVNNGQTHRYRAREGVKPTIPGNCARHKLAEILPSRNVASTGQHICGGCEFLESCRSGIGQFTYLGDRRRILGLSHFRAHIESLDSTAIKSGSVLIVDEASRIGWTRSFQVSAIDIDRTLQDLKDRNLALFAELEPLLQGLLAQMHRSADTRYGFDHDHVMAALPHIPAVSLEQLEELSRQGLEFMTTASDGETKLTDLSPSLRRRFLQDTQTLTEKAAQSIALRWLPEFWQALNNKGRLRIANQKLQITLRNERVIELLKSPALKAVILLDGTELPEFFETWLETEVVQIKQKEPPNNDNVVIYQIGDLGLMGSYRGAQQQRRLQDLIKALQTKHPGAAVIDSKRFAKKGFGLWYRDSRGSNDYTQTKVIVLVGPPIPRIGDKADEFAVMQRKHPSTGTTLRSYTINAVNLPPVGPWWVRTLRESDDAELARFIRRWTLNEVDQAIGRLRADLRPDENLIIYFLSDYPLDREVSFAKASDLIRTAGSGKEQTHDRVIKALAHLMTKNEGKPTYTAIAAKAGVSYTSAYNAVQQGDTTDLRKFQTLVKRPP